MNQRTVRVYRMPMRMIHVLFLLTLMTSAFNVSAQDPPKHRPLRIELVRQNADTIDFRITGRIMLDGGCASRRPMQGLEMQNDTGWVEVYAVERVQMDCGMPWGDWDHDAVRVVLGTWRNTHGRTTRFLAPGRYRVVFIGGAGERVASPVVRLDR